MVGSQSNRPADLSLIYTRNLLSLRSLRVYEIDTYTGERERLYTPTARRQLAEIDAELARRGVSL